MSQKLKGSVFLFIAALIWGSSFIVMKSAVDFLTPAVLLLIRFVLAAIFLAILFFSKIKNLSKENILGGMLTGCCLFAAYYVQTWGLSFTTPGKNAFLTAVYCAIVPFLVWIIHHKRPDIYNFIAAFICILGIGCVSLNGFINIVWWLFICNPHFNDKKVFNRCRWWCIYNLSVYWWSLCSFGGYSIE